MAGGPKASTPPAASSAISRPCPAGAGSARLLAAHSSKGAGLDDLGYDDADIRRILEEVRTIAMIGASANEMRPSYFAMLYLQRKGYRVHPVNPRYAGGTILGETVYADLADLPAPPDMVQIFRKSEDVPPIVEAAIEAGAKVIWMQLGVRHDEAAARAEAAGLKVVMNRCPKIEYGRLYGEIGWLGVDTRVLTAKRGHRIQSKTRKGRIV
ncbi:MAG: CoA-binding protein [Geminicoccaceae bacterium]|nr:CoA-binding protein [Geminicoccaceae bacterium]